MKITDKDGEDIVAANVGDPLSLRFEIVEKNSPYEIFVRELIAMDGLDSEILLVDSLGLVINLHSVHEWKMLNTP